MIWKSITTLLLTCTLLASASPLSASHKKKHLTTYPFETLMGRTKHSIRKVPKLPKRTLGEFAIAKRMYDINIKFLAEPKKLLHIPHIIHVFWIGPKPFPHQSIKNMIAFKKYHPDWKMLFWTDTAERLPPIRGMEKHLITECDFGPVQTYIDSSTNWAEKTDLMRCSVLYKLGGLYADHDVTPLRSFARLADQYDFVAAFERMQYHEGINTYLVPANGLFLSKPGHPILAQALDLSMQRWHAAELRYPNPFDWHRVIYRTFDSFAKAASSLQNHGLNRDLVLPTSYFYPNFAFKKKFTKKLRKKGYVYALHGYYGSWKQSQNAHNPGKSSKKRHKKL